MHKKALLVALCLLWSTPAIAQSVSEDWNNNWGFKTPAEKSIILQGALAQEFVEGGGYTNNNTNNNTNYFSETQNCQIEGACFNGDANSIGNNIIIDGGNGNVVITDNSGDQGAQNNNGNGEINQGDQNND